MPIFLVKNSVMQTAAAPVHVTTGTAIKTMLQIAPVRIMRIIEWGFSFDASAIAAPITVELIETSTVAATVTALAEADIPKLNDTVALAADYMTLSTTGTGFTATAEGTVTATRDMDAPLHMSVFSQPFVKQLPLGQESAMIKGNIYRIRVTAAAALNMRCYMKLST